MGNNTAFVFVMIFRHQEAISTTLHPPCFDSHFDRLRGRTQCTSSAWTLVYLE